MTNSLLNLISTPLPVLNSLGLTTRVGLSSDDPTALRNHNETYQVYLSIYSSEGPLLDRVLMGELPPNRRKFFDVLAVSAHLVSGTDHLAVAHRIPADLLDQVNNLEDIVGEVDHSKYSMYRSMLEYSYPNGGNGSVIYETPPGLNASTNSTSSSLSFTCQIVLSDIINTHIVLMHYSMNPSYSNVADFRFSFFSRSGETVASDHRAIGPFSVSILDVGRTIPEHIIQRDRDPVDGQSSYTFVGSSEDAVIIPLVLNVSPEIGAVALEHTHPPQTYLLPSEASQQRHIKTDAQRSRTSIFRSRDKVR